VHVDNLGKITPDVVVVAFIFPVTRKSPLALRLFPEIVPNTLKLPDTCNFSEGSEIPLLVRFIVKFELLATGELSQPSWKSRVEPVRKDMDDSLLVPALSMKSCDPPVVDLKLFVAGKPLRVCVILPEVVMLVRVPLVSWSKNLD
jgi:hypothetical protein